jgi:TPR repeat protein
MVERENFPTKLAAQYLVATKERRGSLVGRGLLAVQGMKKQQLSLGCEGDAEKLFREGMRYRHDAEYDMPSDLEKCYEYLLKAAKLGHAEAQYELEYLNSELGDSAHEWDRTEPGYWLESSARLGFGPAQYELAVNHFDFDESHALPKATREQMIEAAFAWYEERARAGDPEWQLKFAEIHLVGDVELASRASGARWLIESAKQDYRPACRRLGREFLHSPKVSEHTTQQGIYWLSHAVDLGDAFSCRTLGELYLLGHARGKSARGLPPRRIEPDKKAAISWYERGIAMGEGWAGYDLGTLYLTGEHIDQDLHLAEKWLLHAAKSGDSSAQKLLGLEYASGTRLRQDVGAAIYWLELATKRLKSTGLKLAEIYLDGKIHQKNIQQALKWLSCAADGGWLDKAVEAAEMKCFDGRFSAEEETEAKAWLEQTLAKTR